MRQAIAAEVGARQFDVGEMYERYGAVCVAFARRFVGSTAHADDVVQEVFLALCRQPDRFDPSRGSLAAFLFASVRGRAVDHIRSEDARRRREQRVAHARQVAPAATEELALDSTTAEAVHCALARLGSDERAAITLAYIGGHTYREVARMLAQPEGTVKSRIRTGLQRMQGDLRRHMAAA